jgi:heme-degrading monooxygenase HmoA
MFCRVWTYDVPADSIAGFIEAYGSAGDWAKLFARADGFVRTELYRDTDAPTRFVTIDEWVSEAAWRAFADRWGAAYAELDARLEPLAAGGTLLVESSRQ